MKRFAKVLAGLALLSAMNYVRIKSIIQLPLTFYRACISALSPVLMILGVIATVIGWREKSRNVIVSGMIGSILAGFYIQQATQHHDGFERAFGVGWQDDIDVAQRKYMLQKRFALWLPLVPEPRVMHDLTYATIDGKDLTCDIWQPPAHIKPSGLAMIYCHGGGWYYGYKGFLTDRMFSHLAAQGHVCMDINYRLIHETDTTGMIGDVHRAVAYLKQHSDEYGIDPDRIVISGGSAGGHLAMMLAYAPHHPQLKPDDITIDTSVSGVISFYGIPDIRDFYLFGAEHYIVKPSSPIIELNRTALHLRYPDLDKTQFPLLPQHMVNLLLGGTPDEKPEQCDLFSPIYHVDEHSPPTLLLHGEYDLGIPAQGVTRLATKLRDFDCPVIHNELRYTDHAFDMLFTGVNPTFRTALFDVERFLALL